MKILHLGGYYTVTAQIVQQHQQLGNEVVWIGGAGSESGSQGNPFEMPLGYFALERSLDAISAAAFDVIQVHLSSGLIGNTCQQNIEVFSKLRHSGTQLYFYEYDFQANAGERIDAASEEIAQVLSGASFSHVFCGSVEARRFSSAAHSWSWLAPAFPLLEIEAYPWLELGPQGIRFLHIPFRTTPAETHTIVSAFERLRAEKRPKFSFQIVTPENINTQAALHETLIGCDVLIESISRNSPGILGYEALLRGKTVLSGNAEQARELWPQLGLCPVMHVTQDTLEKRVDSILREPRCLRDLSKRSREYMELYHDAQNMAEQTLAIYQKSA